MTATTAPVTTGGISRLDPSRAGPHHRKPDQRENRAAGKDAAERDAELGVRPLPGIAGGGDDHGDEGEGRAEIARDPPARHREEDQRADAAHQDGEVGVEAHQPRRQNGGAEHRHDMLQAERDGLRPGQPFLRRDDDAVLRRAFRPAVHVPRPFRHAGGRLADHA
jgi:hypothetical protein